MEHNCSKLKYNWHKPQCSMKHTGDQIIAYLTLIFLFLKFCDTPKGSIGLSTRKPALFSWRSLLLILTHSQSLLSDSLNVTRNDSIPNWQNPAINWSHWLNQHLQTGKHLPVNCSTWSLQNIQGLVWSAEKLITCTTSNLAYPGHAGLNSDQVLGYLQDQLWMKVM